MTPTRSSIAMAPLLERGQPNAAVIASQSGLTRAKSGLNGSKAYKEEEMKLHRSIRSDGKHCMRMALR